MPPSTPGHRDAWVEIDLAAIGANARALGSLCSPGCVIAPVVKANAYGHGSVPVSRALGEAGCGVLCVATLDEAFELRSAGIRTRILLLYEPPLHALGDALLANAEVTLGSADGLEAALALPAADRRRLAIQLKIDTGMSRQGLLADRMERVEAQLRSLAGSVRGVWTHLANGADRATATAQLGRFDRAVSWLRDIGIEGERHTSGSAAIMAGYGTAYEMARPGLALYGCCPAEWPDTGMALPIPLRPAMSVRARPSRVEWLPVGARVGYGGTFEVKKPARIALLPVGYADGMRRDLANGMSCVLVSGRKVPVVGRASMDSCTVDVTELGADVPIGRHSVFTLVGRDGNQVVAIEELARAARTIPQEILLGFDRRLPVSYEAYLA
jgi:alanine racemase